MKKILILIIFVLPSIFGGTQTTWGLLWSEEFSGNELNTQFWNYDIGTGDWGWGNNELQYYTNNSNNLSIANGFATIKALDTPFGNSDYTSARIQTKNKFSVQYGKIEARMKLPMGQGLWPAFWMLGQNIDAVSWPSCGEIDIMEHVNNNVNVNGSIHWNQNGHQSSTSTIGLDITDFHVYSIEWNEVNIKWYADGILYKTFNIESDNHSAFHQPFFLILNLAVGGLWPGNPDNTTLFPSEMIVDYIRVYQPIVTEIEERQWNTTFYPNPANQYIHLTESEKITSLHITDMQGKLLISLENPSNKIDIGLLPQGVYNMTIAVDDNQPLHRILIKE